LSEFIVTFRTSVIKPQIPIFANCNATLNFEGRFSGHCHANETIFGKSSKL